MYSLRGSPSSDFAAKNMWVQDTLNATTLSSLNSGPVSSSTDGGGGGGGSGSGGSGSGGGGTDLDPVFDTVTADTVTTQYLSAKELLTPNAIIIGTTINSANVTNCNITTADITTADINTASIDNASMTTVSMTTANVTNCDIKTGDITTANIDTANIETANITTANIETTNITTANITTSTVETSNITTANIDTTNITTDNVETSNITTANIDTANIDTANIITANTTTANVTNATISNLTFNKAPLAYGSVITSDSSGVSSWALPTAWPIFRKHYVTVDDLKSGSLPGDVNGVDGPSSPNASFSKTTDLGVSGVKVAWVVLDGVAFPTSSTSSYYISAPFTPITMFSRTFCNACFITEDYKQATRLSRHKTATEDELNPINRTSFPLISSIICENYTSLGNWLFGTYLGQSGVYSGWIFNTRDTGDTGGNPSPNTQFYIESIYLDNSNATTKVVFKFKTNSDLNSQVVFRTGSRILVFYSV